MVCHHNDDFTSRRDQGTGFVHPTCGTLFPSHGRMMATMLASIAQFKRDLMSERIKSGLAAAKARGKKSGRQKDSGQNLID